MVFVADDAFPLTKHCMKPYGRKNLSDEEKVFNYRCSRFRRISENGFVIWSNRFRLFATPASLTPEKAEVAVMASLVLHNLLRTKSRESYTPIGSIDFENETGEVIEGTWNQEVVCTNLQPSAPCRASMAAEEVRNQFKLHFNGPGQIPFQWRVLHK